MGISAPHFPERQLCGYNHLPVIPDLFRDLDLPRDLLKNAVIPKQLSFCSKIPDKCFALSGTTDGDKNSAPSERRMEINAPHLRDDDGVDTSFLRHPELAPGPTKKGRAL